MPRPAPKNNTLLISDLHLCAERPAVTDLFLRFLERDAAECDTLYILGDLFEAWLGDDDTCAENARIVAGLRRLTRDGVPVYIMHGNRDFLIGAEFERLSGCTLLADPSVIDLYGERTLLMHGDTLCTLDTEYQRMRTQLRNPDWQRALLALPLAQRAALAQQYRAQSREKTRVKSEYIMDVEQRTVEDVMRDHHVKRLIHGHTHRPALHEFTIDGHTVQRMVLGDWYEQGSVLRCSAAGCVLDALPLAA